MGLFKGCRFSIPPAEHTGWKPGERAHLVRTIEEHGGRLNHPSPTHVLVTLPFRPTAKFMEYLSARPGVPVLSTMWVYECELAKNVFGPNTWGGHQVVLQRVHSSPRRALDVQMVQYDDPWKMGPVSGDLHYDCDYHDLDNTTELGSHAIVKHGLVTPPLSTASVIPLAPCQAPNTPGPTAYVMCNDYDECQLRTYEVVSPPVSLNKSAVSIHVPSGQALLGLVFDSACP